MFLPPFHATSGAHPVGRRYHIRAYPTVCTGQCLPYEMESGFLLIEANNNDSFERICHNIALAAAPGLCRAFDVGSSPWIYSHRVAVKSASEAFVYAIDLWMYIAPVGLHVWLFCNTLDRMIHGDFRRHLIYND